MSIQSAASVRLQVDLQDADLQAGVETDRWRILRHVGDELVIEVRIGESDSYLAIKVDVADYPAVAPAGSPWDMESDQPLAQDKWPVWPRPDMGFRKDWSPSNGNGPYWSWDRVALASHPDWANAMPGKAWHEGRTILHYLRETAREMETSSVALVSL